MGKRTAIKRLEAEEDLICKRLEIKEATAGIQLKCSIVLIFAIFIPVFILCQELQQKPEDWIKKEIIYSKVSFERVPHVGKGSTHNYVVVSQDGQMFTIPIKYAPEEVLAEKLVFGEKYTIVYSTTGIGKKIMEGLYNENEVFLDLNDSIARWEDEQNELKIAVIVNVVLVIVGLILINIFWCKKEHKKIKELRADIKNIKAQMKEY